MERKKSALISRTKSPDRRRLSKAAAAALQLMTMTVTASALTHAKRPLISPTGATENTEYDGMEDVDDDDVPF